MGTTDPRRLIPRTDRLLAHESIRRVEQRLGPNLVRGIIRQVQDQARAGDLAPQDVEDQVVAALAR
ncbi:L-seryl-tRNA(Sec) selenium transferase, partial [Glutamicibacter creatinolyticus]